MNLDYKEYQSLQEISVRSTLKDKKLMKYFNLETAALIKGIHNILSDNSFHDDMPLFFALCKIDFKTIASSEIFNTGQYFDNFKIFDSDIEKFPRTDFLKIPALITENYSINGKFSPELFNKNFFSKLSPIEQFKVLANLPVSFASIVFGLHGDNVTIYESGRSLVWHGVTTDYQGVFLIGSAKTAIDGSVKAGIAYTSSEELQTSKYFTEDICAIEMFKNWNEQGFH
ncbi:MAG: hypothetical protein OEV78_05570 [Spirochaetia bacterium]|nr:hypothetical protein [Spirochaetia bacterium]